MSLKHLEEFAAMVQSPLIKGTQPQLVNLVCSLGMFLDSLLMQSSHIQTKVSNAFYHLHSAGRLHPILADNDLDSAIHAFITSQLDYDNMIDPGTKPSTFRKKTSSTKLCSMSPQQHQPLQAYQTCVLLPLMPFHNNKLRSRSQSLCSMA